LQVIEAVWNSIKERWKKENDDVETEWLHKISKE
jgi:hypothetical protein